MSLQFVDYTAVYLTTLNGGHVFGVIGNGRDDMLCSVLFWP